MLESAVFNPVLRAADPAAVVPPAMPGADACCSKHVLLLFSGWGDSHTWRELRGPHRAAGAYPGFCHRQAQHNSVLMGTLFPLQPQWEQAEGRYPSRTQLLLLLTLASVSFQRLCWALVHKQRGLEFSFSILQKRKYPYLWGTTGCNLHSVTDPFLCLR